MFEAVKLLVFCGAGICICNLIILVAARGSALLFFSDRVGHSTTFELN